MVQTYQNLEIILVDDGSPDRCGAICDEYAAADDRVTVVHQKNGGLSAARNAGLSLATGEFLGFVDSDDWIEPDMFEYLQTHIDAAKADIAICGHFEDYHNRSVLKSYGKTAVINQEEALNQLLIDRLIQNHVWNKLWRASLFQGVRFPEGRNFEDIAVSYILFQCASDVVCLPEGKYHYTKRDDSILADTSLKDRLDYCIAAKIRCDAMEADWPQFRDLLSNACMKSAVGIWCVVCDGNGPKERMQFRDQLQEIALFAQSHYKAAMQSAGLGLAGKLVLPLTPHASW